MGADPDDRQVVAVATGQGREGCDADRALSTKGHDPRRVVLTDDVQGLGQLIHDHRLGLHDITFSQTLVCHGHRRPYRWTLVRRQDCLQHGRAHRVSATTHLERELRREMPHAYSAGSLAFRPDQAKADPGFRGGLCRHQFSG